MMWMSYVAGKNAMQPLHVKDLSEDEFAALDRLYRTSKVPRLRERAQMILLAAEQGMLAHEIAPMVRRDEQSVRRWIKRFNAGGVNGLEDRPRPGAESKITPQYRARLLEIVRRRPRTLDLPFSLWSLQRLADFMAEETSIRVSDETVRRVLKEGGIVLSRPQHTITSPDPEYKIKKRRLKTSGTP